MGAPRRQMAPIRVENHVSFVLDGKATAVLSITDRNEHRGYSKKRSFELEAALTDWAGTPAFMIAERETPHSDFFSNFFSWQRLFAWNRFIMRKLKRRKAAQKPSRIVSLRLAT